jgi:5-methylcytosine-specific restriction protein A
MRWFDQEERDRPPWLNWEANKAHHFAIQYEDRLYPVKRIISLATGLPVGNSTEEGKPTHT